MNHVRSPRPWIVGLVATATTVGMLGVPPTAAGGEPTGPRMVRLQRDAGSVVRAAEVPVAAGTQRLRSTSYSMVAATWDPDGTAPRVSVRTRPGEAWQELPPLSDAPDERTAEGRSELGATGLLWTGPATGIDVRVEGPARDVELVLIDPGERAADSRVAAQPRVAPDDEKPDRAPEPTWRTRKDWGADPSWRNGKPYYLSRMKQVHLHHTASANGYKRKDVPGIIRGMYRYHTKTLGWFDIGYNFLVDRFGRIWVGRSGGPRKLVRGAHTLGFNHSSVGIAVIGNFQDRTPRKAVLTSLKKLAAWKFDKYDRKAKGKVWIRSSGSDKYKEGKLVRLPAFDGHRDTNDTACPGDDLYDLLPKLRRITQRRINHFS